MLAKDRTDKRKARHQECQEDFTPDSVLEILCDVDDKLFTDFSKTFLDPCAGNGNIYIFVLKKRLYHCTEAEEIYSAIETMYGTELMQDNVDEFKERVLEILNNYELNRDRVLSILNHNIVCTDTFKWDYENWKPIDNALF